ncbi:MAG: hypothetical protein KF794_08360 [Xanthobacteraceae bacterium]|nr:hypothetical protein [Xanthobacteraceae bacterium]QYK43823.1 MAG: hypothetical protein KF794_08360 [Xanthobacteraceae bacterium]
MTRAAAFKNARADQARHPVRPAGKDAMRDPPAEWDKLDEIIDESFPASDPPAHNTRGVKKLDERVLKRAFRKN